MGIYMNYLKYLVYAMILYLLFTFIPKNKIYLIDLLTIVASLIAFNVAYDLLEMTLNKSVLEGYDPKDNTALFSEVNSLDSNLRYGFDQKFQELSPYANFDDKEEVEEPKMKSESKEDNIKKTVMQQEPSEIPKE